jgi:hypothetical protein
MIMRDGFNMKDSRIQGVKDSSPKYEKEKYLDDGLEIIRKADHLTYSLNPGILESSNPFFRGCHA